jgi:cysteinyl-tRNA synthetase
MDHPEIKLSPYAADLIISNNLTRSKDRFEPLNAPYVGLYVCGPTVYSNVHLGNVRTFLTFDVIYRYLCQLGYQIRYVRNITDVGHLIGDTDEGEDKIGAKARLENLEPMEIVQRYTNDFQDVMRVFNILSPSIEPTATGHIIEQIEMIEQIMSNGYAYEANGSIYFDVRKFSEKHDYGALSGRKIDDLRNATRELDGQSEKRDPLDFALWKKAGPTHLMHWPSPWSVGFPGWHLECSVMSTRYLGKQFDIHGGGMDLKFPHHECEIAQNIGAYGGELPVRYWIHGNMLTVNGRKMSKSEGNGFTPEELISGNHKLLERGYSPMTVRFFMLQGHYAGTLDFSNAALQAAEKGLQRLMAAWAKIENLPTTDTGAVDIAGLRDRCYAAMNDDFNTPVLIATLYDGVKCINSAADGRLQITAEQKSSLSELFCTFAGDVMGLKFEVDTSENADNRSDGLMALICELRASAKANKNWAMADEIRDQLAAIGVQIKDGKDGASWEFD